MSNPNTCFLECTFVIIAKLKKIYFSDAIIMLKLTDKYIILDLVETALFFKAHTRVFKFTMF